jgi:hypothetical protein
VTIYFSLYKYKGPNWLSGRNILDFLLNGNSSSVGWVLLINSLNKKVLLTVPSILDFQILRPGRQAYNSASSGLHSPGMNIAPNFPNLKIHTL